MVKLKNCPCGSAVSDLHIAGVGLGGKWAFVTGAGCCGEWMIEFRTNYEAFDSEECKRLAREAWNNAPRALDSGCKLA